MATKKDLRIFSVILIVTMLLTLSACTDDEAQINIEECYQIRTNSDLTYSYEITNLRGKVIFSESSVIKPPKIRPLSNSVLEVSAQAGTGLSTNRAVFCDVKNSNVSETFHYVLGVKGDNVVCADYKEGKHFITVQNIFDKSIYYKTYELENVSPIAADFALGCEFDSDNKVTITYLAGEDYTETKLIINIP